jgi:hypothetical protein
MSFLVGSGPRALRNFVESYSSRVREDQQRYHKGAGDGNGRFSSTRPEIQGGDLKVTKGTATYRHDRLNSASISLHTDPVGDGWVEDGTRLELSKTTELGRAGLFGLFGQEQKLEIYSARQRHSYENYTSSATATFQKNGKLVSYRTATNDASLPRAFVSAVTSPRTLATIGVAAAVGAALGPMITPFGPLLSAAITGGGALAGHTVLNTLPAF